MVLLTHFLGNKVLRPPTVPVYEHAFWSANSTTLCATQATLSYPMVRLEDLSHANTPHTHARTTRTHTLSDGMPRAHNKLVVTCDNRSQSVSFLPVLVNSCSLSADVNLCTFCHQNIDGVLSSVLQCSMSQVPFVLNKCLCWRPCTPLWRSTLVEEASLTPRMTFGVKQRPLVI